MEDCIFCKVISGELPSYKVYEDEDVYAFLDIHPIKPGHTLVIPKFHEPDFFKLEDSLYEKVMAVVKKLSTSVDKAMNPDKVGLIIAGWDVPHTHIHIVPMHDYHDITSKTILDNKTLSLPKEEMAKILEKIKGSS